MSLLCLELCHDSSSKVEAKVLKRPSRLSVTQLSLLCLTSHHRLTPLQSHWPLAVPRKCQACLPSGLSAQNDLPQDCCLTNSCRSFKAVFRPYLHSVVYSNHSVSYCSLPVHTPHIPSPCYPILLSLLFLSTHHPQQHLCVSVCSLSIFYAAYFTNFCSFISE